MGKKLHSYLGIALVTLCSFTLVNSPVFAVQRYNQQIIIQSQKTLTSLKARVSDKKPKQNSKVTAYCEIKDQNAKPITGVKCSFKWKYKTVTHTMTANTGKDGQAKVSRSIGRASKGKKVEIVVTANYGNVTKTATTHFVPR